MMTISRRLETIINMTEKCGVLADIGCDHAYVSIGVLESGKAEHVIAADVAEGPLRAAKANAELAGKSENITFILSDGLQKIENSALNCVVIAGMGGTLVRNILTDAKLERFPELKQLVLGPQSDLDIVRHYLVDEMHFTIVNEKCIFDEGKYYFLMDVRNIRNDNDLIKSGKVSGIPEPYEDFEYFYGRNIDPDTADCYINYLNFRLNRLSIARDAAAKGSSEKNKDKLEVLDRDIRLVNKALMKAGTSND